jgi:hypothetical protein
MDVEHAGRTRLMIGGHVSRGLGLRTSNLRQPPPLVQLSFLDTTQYTSKYGHNFLFCLLDVYRLAFLIAEDFSLQPAGITLHRAIS